jgi:hypothetical protein
MKRVVCGVTCMLSLIGMVHAEDRTDTPLALSDQQFLIGVGQGDLTKGRLVCERVAELAARADLAKQIRVQVKENIHDRVRERTGRNVEQDIEIVREEQVSELLQHVRIIERRVDPDTGLCTSKAIMQR